MANLFKTFINSAVSQIGRDGGRVISNKIYGDRHAIPIRGVSNHSVVEVDGEIISSDFKPEPWLSNQWWYYLLVGFSIPLMFWIQWSLFAGSGLTYFSKNVTKVKVKKSVGVYQQDRRFNGGKKLIGNRVVEDFIPIEAPKEHLLRYRIKGVLHLLLSALLVYFTYLLVKSFGWL